MTANLSGAKLREVERDLATLRGEEAVDAYIAQHPHEVRVLEQLVEWRRAGRAAPSLARIQRVMIWSDGQIEFKTEQPAEAARGASSRAGASGTDRRTGGPLRGGAGVQPPRGGRRPGAPPRPGRRRPNEEATDWRSVPRSGQGWSLLREGQPLPAEQLEEERESESVGAVDVKDDATADATTHVTPLSTGSTGENNKPA